MKRYRELIFLIALICVANMLVGCGDEASNGDTSATASTHPESIKASPENPPTIDGVLAADEWEGATVEVMTDGSELFLMHASPYLYLGVRSNTPEMIGANVYIEDSGQIKILHTSAALGMAIYRREAVGWQQLQGFDWQCRDTSNSEKAQAERDAYLLENLWLAANSRIGAPDELEYQIELPEVAPRIAVSVFRSSAPDERAFWPLTLEDDSVASFPGGLPTALQFSPEQWGTLEVSK